MSPSPLPLLYWLGRRDGGKEGSEWNAEPKPDRPTDPKSKPGEGPDFIKK